MESNAAAFDLITAARNERNGFCVSLVFFNENARGERVGRIVIKHRNDSLRDDRPAIQCLVNEMNCAAGELDSMLDGLTLRVESGKCRKQTRMNVEYAVAESLCEAGREQAHVTC